MYKDYYKILNVNIFSNIDSIKKSYRELAMKYHPDRNSGDILSEKKFKDITEAYEILSDEKKRMEYNLKYLVNSKYLIGGLAIAGLGLGLILSKSKK
ncbi:DnaJ domain-containing protein [uncultured Brachyspira sp.]|uniref:DnaJ domain-containing protein n=1 Tax=uncultured Brachyspira sp. TaxID=221953 RepID=UPI00260D51CE|nr:DnaJ domain-containing protein [uncultured Brachyspira sp.]